MAGSSREALATALLHEQTAGSLSDGILRNTLHQPAQVQHSIPRPTERLMRSRGCWT